MECRPLLIFDLDGARFGVDAALVSESVWLAELAAVEEAPRWIVGVFGWRGRIVPVADLRLRFGHAARPYSPSDRVVVVESGSVLIGLLASDVIEVVELPCDAVQPPPLLDGAVHGPVRIVTGEAHVGCDLVSLIDVSGLAGAADCAKLAAGAEPAAAGAYFCPQATPAERALFRARAAALRAAAAEETGAVLGLAVVEVGGERFGIELAAVREFCNVKHVQPIPCCPPHILGAINLRGDLISLIDPRAALNLPLSGTSGGKAVIGSIGEQPVAIAVDEVHDVVYLRADELQAPPSALRERCGAEVAGAARYAGGMMTVLDLPALLGRAQWIVDEAV